jgi:hypothetical protein
MPTEVGTQTNFNKTADAARSARTASGNALHVAWIPACAGMTEGGATSAVFGQSGRWAASLIAAPGSGSARLLDDNWEAGAVRRT